ncbi:PD-(D/E)XK nuclease superfamily protein [Thermanaerosceptrum fracticalcis]|jgi:hypothetical protein|nr:PD-(D/E)XK nuclease superfamily protein [Thermanaerosceptrum fracticalcis]
MSSQGGHANSTGGTLEKSVVGALTSKGFQVVPYRKWIKCPKNYGNELLLTNAPYKTIYNHSGNSEFLLLSNKYNMRIRIECKWQQSAGSVDEKFPYLYLNAVEVMPEAEIIIIVDGGGYKKGAVEWLKSAAAEKKYIKTNNPKKIRIMNLSEFLVWVNTTFR